MLTVVVGVVLAAGMALKHFMPSLVGQVTGKITGAVCTLASDRLDMCSSPGGEDTASAPSAPPSAPSGPSSSGGGGGAAGPVGGIDGGGSGSFGGGATPGGSSPMGGGGTVSGGGAPLGGGGSSGGSSAMGSAGSSGGSSSMGGGAGSPSLAGGVTGGGGGGSFGGGSPGGSSGGGASAGGAPLQAPAAGGGPGAAAAQAPADRVGSAAGAPPQAGGAQAGGASAPAGEAGPAGPAGAVAAASKSAGALSWKGAGADAGRLTLAAAGGDQAARGELAQVWKRLPKSEYLPASDVDKQRRLESELSANKDLKNAYKHWGELDAQKRKAALQQESDIFSRVYGLDGTPLVFGAADEAGHFAEDGSIFVADGALADRDAAFSVVLHASAHRYENDLVARFDRGEIPVEDDRYTQAQVFKMNSLARHSSSGGFDARRNQPLEAYACRAEGAVFFLKDAAAQPPGQRLQRLLGGSSMAQARTKLVMGAVGGLAFGLMIAGCFLLIGRGKHAGAAAAPGARAILVSLREKAPDGKEEAWEIGNVILDREGGLDVSIMKEGRGADILRGAVDAARIKGTLRLLVEEDKEVGGKPVASSSALDVAPADPRYIWAVAAFLTKDYGLECEIK